MSHYTPRMLTPFLFSWNKHICTIFLPPFATWYTPLLLIRQKGAGLRTKKQCASVYKRGFSLTGYVFGSYMYFFLFFAIYLKKIQTEFRGHGVQIARFLVRGRRFERHPPFDLPERCDEIYIHPRRERNQTEILFCHVFLFKIYLDNTIMSAN